MRWLLSVAVLAGLSGCESLAPLEESERARIRRVAPVAARFPPAMDFRMPPTKAGGAADAAAALAGEGALVAELAVGFVGASFAGRDGRLQLALSARLRLVRPSDGTALMTRHYSVARSGRFAQEYEEDHTLLLRAIAGMVDEVAMLMVDDAFLLRAGTPPALEALEPVPAGACFRPAYDCPAFKRVPRLETPTFRWKALQHDAARNIVYDPWIFGGDDDRLVEGLRTTEHTLERALPACMRYAWAVRARFDGGSGPRALDWSGRSRNAEPGMARGFPGLVSVVRPFSGAYFLTPCPPQRRE